MRCISQKAEISAMAECIRLITLQAPPSPTNDDMIHNIVPQNVASPPSEDDFVNELVVPDMPSTAAMLPVIEEVIAISESTPLHDTVISEGLCTAMPGSSCAVGPHGPPARSGQHSVARGAARRVLFSDDRASSST